MARRIITVDDRDIIVDSDNPTLDEGLRRAGKSIAKGAVVPGKGIISQKDFGKTPLPDRVYTNPTDIEKGTLRDRLINEEMDLIAKRFLATFPGKRRQIIRDDNDTYLLIANFPLPDNYDPDYVDLLIVTVGYPDVPPAGVHVPVELENLREMGRRLGGHIMPDENLPKSYKQHVHELERHGWRWICYHYNDWQWQLNPNNLLSGDCLFKYVESLYAVL